MKTYEADLTWTGARFERGVRVTVDRGWIVETRPGPVERLPGRALLPGFVDAHSHAFQRGLRGRSETGGTFWSWRDAMYALAEGLDAARLKALSVQAFREMRAAGIACVGEFHYLRHAGAAEDYALDEAVLEAAEEAGIRIVLLSAFYAAGGIGKPPTGAQLRFRATLDGYWRQVDRLLAFKSERRAFGAAVHSVRAASLEELSAVHAEARRRGMVFHMHLEEQRREIEECVAAYGRTPMEIVLDLAPDERFTAVHATHTQPDALRRFVAKGARVCACPLTEANLGDGIGDVAAMGDVALGTDSNARISMLEEMRWLEYAQRLRHERRGVLRDPDGSVARRLLRAATEGGARTLGVPAGRIAPGHWADLLAVDLSHPSLAGWSDDTLAESLVFGAEASALAPLPA